MDDSPFPVQRSLLSDSAMIERVLARYDLAGPLTCRFWQRGINDLYLVQAGATRLMLRVSPAGWLPREQVAAELELLDYLGQRGILAPQPIRQRDGTCLQALTAPEGSRYAVLLTFVPGAPPGPTEHDSARYGRAIAEFHAATDGYPAGTGALCFEPADMADEPLERLRPFFAGRPADHAYLVEVAAGLKEAAGRLPRRSPEYGICHGDVNAGNLHLIGADGWALLDLEFFGRGWRAFDIATFFNNQVQDRGRSEETRRLLEAFLAGYQSVRRLSQAELAALPAFVVLRQLWLLGRGVKNEPNIGLRVFEGWLFDRCLPFIREWMAEPLWHG